MLTNMLLDVLLRVLDVLHGSRVLDLRLAQTADDIFVRLFTITLFNVELSVPDALLRARALDLRLDRVVEGLIRAAVHHHAA